MSTNFVIKNFLCLILMLCFVERKIGSCDLIINKFNFSDRRTFLRNSAVLTGSATTLAWPGSLMAQVQQVQTQRLSDKVLLVQGPDSNVLIVESSAGLVMVDGGHSDWFGSLHSAIADNFPGQSTRALFNTHRQPEQTGSNLALGEQGVEKISHENTRQSLSIFELPLCLPVHRIELYRTKNAAFATAPRT